MHNFLTVAIVDGGEDLFDDICGILLAKVLLLGDSLEQLAAEHVDVWHLWIY